MDIEQIRRARAEMEKSIKAAVSSAMREFHAQTGLDAQTIDVRLVDVTPVGAREKQFAVSEVRADVPL